MDHRNVLGAEIASRVGGYGGHGRNHHFAYPEGKRSHDPCGKARVARPAYGHYPVQPLFAVEIENDLSPAFRHHLGSPSRVGRTSYLIDRNSRGSGNLVGADLQIGRASWKGREEIS